MERWPITGAFTISRGAKTEAVTVTAAVSRGGMTGRGECVPYPRYGETPEATLAALRAMQEPLRQGLDRREAASRDARRRRPQCAGLRAG
jgi:L-Ala-D/L-Glu epimerase